MKDYVYNKYDIEAAKIIDDFLPDKMFDVHMHITLNPDKYNSCMTFDDYYRDMKIYTGNRLLRCNGILNPEVELLDNNLMDTYNKFCASELDKYPQNVGEVIVLPTDTYEDIEKRIIHPNILGLKCYHVFANRPDTFNACIGEYLPETAWQIANDKKLVITLHMVKNEALAHPDNLNYIKTMSKKYPDAVLILAHAARSFASWTAFGTIDELVDCENVWYDFSAICESPSIQYIIKKIGTKRCMWGTDYPISMFAGKAISLADRFYWISDKDLMSFASKTEFHSWHIATEEFMALRQATILADLRRSDIEDIFYNNADKLFSRK